ncbi:MAG: ribonuclease P protein component [Burkholderiaceae bacterium]|nr:ribonuclease P protein component [Burkholderiaceae bacterium]
MPRARVDAEFAALSRRRPDLVSEHFGLALMMRAPHDTASSLGRLGFAVPKRQLARAVDRNALKRVAREAWRHARWAPASSPAVAMLKLRRANAQWRATPRLALKRAWRSELDQLFARAAARGARA